MEQRSSGYTVWHVRPVRLGYAARPHLGQRQLETARPPGKGGGDFVPTAHGPAPWRL
jgi:hypothetical protein